MKNDSMPDTSMMMPGDIMRIKTNRRKIVSFLLIFIMTVTLCFAGPEDASAAGSSYWLKVNKKANVVTVYKKVSGKWKPVKAMLCSCGKTTPSGTFRTGRQRRWGALILGQWAQYTTRIKGPYLFHSVPYRSRERNSMYAKEYQKLGKLASHGCVRLSMIDAKWIYKNCRKGTKVTIYKSSKAGPLGKPKKVSLSKKKGYSWDPTDKSSSNKYFALRKPVITVSADKASSVSVGETYDIKSGVTAVNTNANQDITALLEYSVEFDSGSGYVKAEFSTDVPGKYRIKYYVSHKYSGYAQEYFYIKVTETQAPQPSDGLEGKFAAKIGSGTQMSFYERHVI